MKMKIYTYSDPFKINKQAYWDEIKRYPHLCVSQTLVEGLKAFYGRSQFSYICTIQSVMEKIYGDWISKPENQMKQYITLSKAINNINDDKLKRSFKSNQKEVLSAIRLLVEMHANEELKTITTNNNVHEVFKQIFNTVINSADSDWCWDQFKYMFSSTKEDIKLHLDNVLDEEVFKYLHKKKNHSAIDRDDLFIKLKAEKDNKLTEVQKVEIERYIQLLLMIDTLSINKVVIHGVHQFSPMILNFIKHLQKCEVEVIFLIPYSLSYPKIYQTWRRVYDWTGEEFIDIHDIEKQYQFHPAAKAMGNFIEGKFESIERIREKLLKFDNLTAFANYTSEVFEEARRKFTNKKREDEENESVENTTGSKVIGRMSEQFYAPNTVEVNAMLQSYFPEQFGEKHFLSYPIGQFILALYNMWNPDIKDLELTESQIRECLAFNIWDKAQDFTPIQIYDQIKQYVQDSNTLTEWIERIDNLRNKTIKYRNQKFSSEHFRRYSFFNLGIEEVDYIKGVLLDLQSIARQIFDSSDNDRIKIAYHFKRLIEILSEKVEDRKAEISEEESKLVDELKNRFENLQEGELEGSIHDLKETIHYFLNSRKDDDQANWIVRNFEQIDGAVLLSRNSLVDNRKPSRTAYYHFAMLSDNNMNPKIGEMLPWPLNEDFINELKVIDAEIIKCSYREYKNFLRYSLFFGILFSDKNLKFSYVSTKIDEEDREQLPYFLMSIIGLKEEEEWYSTLTPFKEKLKVQGFYSEELDIKNPDELDCEMFSICPERFVLNNIIDGEVIYKNDWQSWWYTIEVLRQGVLHLIDKHPSIYSKDDLDKPIDELIHRLREYHPYLKDSDFADLKTRALNKIKSDISYPKDEKYWRRVNLFLTNKISDENGGNILKFNTKSHQKLKSWLKSPDNIDGNNYFHQDKCKLCNQRDMCLESFVKEEENE